MTPLDSHLPPAVERTLLFLDEAERHRLTLSSAKLPPAVRSAEAFAARFAAPERQRPMLRFLDPDEVRETMAWLPRPRVRTEIVEVERVVEVERRVEVEKRVEVEIEKRIYVPMRTFPPR